MLDRRLELPNQDDRVPLASKLTPQLVLEACADHVPSPKAAAHSSWSVCRVLDVLYHPGRYLSAAFVLLDSDKTTPDRYWADGQIIYIRQPVRFPISQRGALIEIDGQVAELYRFPNDRRLRDLRRISSRSTIAELWSGWSGVLSEDQPEIQRQLLRYVPEKKCVARIKARSEHEGDPVLSSGVALRVSSTKLAERIAHVHHLGAARSRKIGDALRLPDCVYADTDRGITAIEWVKGRPLLEVLAGDEAELATSRVVAALEDFHRLDLPGLEPMTPAIQREFTDSAVDELLLAAPEHSDRLNSLRQWVNEALSGINPGDLVTIHNDFYFDQVLIRSKNCVFVDFERVCRGDALIDVANYAVQLRMLAYRPEFGLSAEQARAGAAGFLNHYSSVLNGVGAERRCCAYGAVALLALARAMARHLRPGWRLVLEKCLGEMETLISSEAPQRTA